MQVYQSQSAHTSPSPTKPSKSLASKSQVSNALIDVYTARRDVYVDLSSAFPNGHIAKREGPYQP